MDHHIRYQLETRFNPLRAEGLEYRRQTEPLRLDFGLLAPMLAVVSSCLLIVLLG